MSISLYDAVVGTYQQIIPALEGVLEKGKAHCEEQGIALDDVVESKLIGDMLPFRFQVVSVAHHSMNALKGAQEGLFGPPKMANEDYGQLQQLLSEARESISAYSADDVNALVGKEMEFRMGSLSMPFTAENFLLSFSLPNFYFHAATAYDLLRQKGVQIGKQDFLGRVRVKR